MPVPEVRRYEADLLAWMRTRHAGLLAGIRDTGQLDEDALKAALAEFGNDFVAGTAESSVPVAQVVAAPGPNDVPASGNPEGQ